MDGSATPDADREVDFLGRDSILAAPIALDLVLFLDLAKRNQSLQGRSASRKTAELLPQVAADARGSIPPEHDLFIQSMKLKNTLRHIMGADLITHLGLEYYD